MKRLLASCLLTGLIGLCGITDTFAQAPRGYLFFAHRNRPVAAAAATQAKADKTKSATAKCCGIPEDPVAPTLAKRVSPIPVKVEAAKPEPAGPEVRQATMQNPYGLNYGYVREGYSPGYANYAFGAPPTQPLHGYRANYDWAGNAYSMHCYCAQNNCPDNCPGYRGACFCPGWNDNGWLVFERRCGRGSPLDCLWHMGGYECPCRCTDCPYVCNGAPRFYSYGFPRGTAGDPNYRQPRGTVPKTPPETYPDPNPPILESRPSPIELPEDARIAPPKTPPRPGANGTTPPKPMPEE